MNTLQEEAASLGTSHGSETLCEKGSQRLSKSLINILCLLLILTHHSTQYEAYSGQYYNKFCWFKHVCFFRHWCIAYPGSFDRKRLKFSKNNRVLRQPNHFPTHKEWYWPTLCQAGTYILVGSYIKFQYFSRRYLNSSRFFNSGLRSIERLPLSFAWPHWWLCVTCIHVHIQL